MTTPAVRPRRTLRLAVATVGALVMLFPLYWMLVTAVSSPAQLYGKHVRPWPGTPRWSNFTETWHTYPFGDWLVNSLVIAVLAVVLTVVINLAAGYAFAKLRFPGRDLMFLLILSTLMVPIQVIMVPQFQIVAGFGLLDNDWGVILPRLAEAFGLFMVRQFMLAVPDELIEAAKCDGASHLRIFVRIVLPQCKPVIAVLVIFTFMYRWNEFAWPLIVLKDPHSYTLPVGLLMLKSQFGFDYASLMAMALLSVLPMLVVFAVFQRFFVAGIARTGLK